MSTMEMLRDSNKAKQAKQMALDDLVGEILGYTANTPVVDSESDEEIDPYLEELDEGKAPFEEGEAPPDAGNSAGKIDPLIHQPNARAQSPPRKNPPPRKRSIVVFNSRTQRIPSTHIEVAARQTNTS
eukprot:TRINITY_DN20011_c0_g1_i1.p1 TRINITY_DN20011_c0_g1~~TRINITY_DN20011_c0_g1_i1.p1  ORF type:complete len:135 (-),score=18.35 TRINITY_DN20011_c0_g1_i1:146-529(-)